MQLCTQQLLECALATTSENSAQNNQKLQTAYRLNSSLWEAVRGDAGEGTVAAAGECSGGCA